MTQRVPQSRDRLRRIARKAMRDRGLLPDFSPAALAETAATSGGAPTSSDTRDLRDLLWASIDNDDSRDLDQLTVAEARAGGMTRIFVAVADVDATVRPGSAIDEHARMNTTSVYTAAQVFPMLPERLSTDLTSLGEGEERLALVVALEVSARGEVGEAEIFRALVKNQAKLAYDGVAAWLDGSGPAPPRVRAVRGMDEQLRLQDGIAQAMKERRHGQGSLSLATQEAHAVFDGDTLTGLRPEERNRAKELIEDYMIAANGAVARFFKSRRLPSLRRILRSPERWGRIVELAATFGATLPPAPDARALAAFLLERREADPDRFQDLSLSVVKLIGRGEYVLDAVGETPAGHFGLAVSDYTHSTAPNRRYPDVIEQRLVKAALAGQAAPYDAGALRALAEHCTEQEANADKVERRVRKSAAALLLESRVGEHFDAIVTGASAKGTWVRITRPPVEGRVVRGAKGMDVGDRVRVELLETDVEKGFIDFGREKRT